MPLPSTGPLGLSQIQGEFGGANPTSLSEYYRGGPLVVGGLQNSNVPTSGRVSISNFRSSSKTVVVTYEIIGAGGAGGYGLEDGGGFGRGGDGSNSEIIGPSINIIAPGGSGGLNGGIGFSDFVNREGKGSFYGPGGAAGLNGLVGGDAPASSYGSGGGGAGGDSPSQYDSSGNAGEGGFAGTRLTGTFTIPYGTNLSISIGVGGLGNGARPGGRGADGYCKLMYDDKVVNIINSQSVNII